MKSHLEDIFISYTHAETTNHTAYICEHFLLLYKTPPFRMDPAETRNKKLETLPRVFWMSFLAGSKEPLAPKSTSAVFFSFSTATC